MAILLLFLYRKHAMKMVWMSVIASVVVGVIIGIVALVLGKCKGEKMARGTK
jgi:uncharacterized membrane-anchored protein YhcB (DUF1043 family)